MAAVYSHITKTSDNKRATKIDVLPCKQARIKRVLDIVNTNVVRQNILEEIIFHKSI